MTGPARAKAALGARLRELRKDAGLDGRQLSTAAGWHWSKTSRIELGKQMPSESDLAVWCRVCEAPLALPDLIAALRNVQAQWAEWKRVTAAGHERRQRKSVDLMSRTRLLRTYTTELIPGLLQTRDYAREVLRTCIGFVGTHNDLDAAVSARMARQRVLHEGTLQIYALVHEAALWTTLGNDAVMAAQLRHLLRAAFGNVRLVFGVVPLGAPFVYSTTSFDLWDGRAATVETISAELSIATPSELQLYEKAWDGLRANAVYGDAARARITAALERRTGRDAAR
ncbi:helix-turn-helix domain-containing protein [Nocardia gipuzkoensis]